MTLELDRSTLSELFGNNFPRKACFVIISGLDVGEVIQLDSSRIMVIGRDSACDCVIRDDGISRRHAEVFCHDREQFTIRDLGSTNGIFVEGKRIESHVLAEGDKVLLGRHTILKFVFQDHMDLIFQKQMYESSVRDALTGAFNRKHFDERISSEMSFALRHRSPVSLLMFDLDHFKKINDTFGHQAGDQVLITVARVIFENLRQEDIFARYGGEEFVVIARGIDNEGAKSLGERLRCLVEEIKITSPKGERIPLTVSIGVCTVPGGLEASPTELISQADKLLYRAKEGGRNRVEASDIVL